MASIYSLSCRLFPQSFLLTITRGRVDKKSSICSTEKELASLWNVVMMHLSTQSHLNSCDLKAQIGPVRSSTSASSVPSLQKGPQAPLTSSSKKGKYQTLSVVIPLGNWGPDQLFSNLKSGNKHPKNSTCMYLYVLVWCGVVFLETIRW